MNLSGAQTVDNASVDVQLGASLRGTTVYSSRRVGNIVYAFALRNLGGTNKYSVAYRYERVNNPDAPNKGKSLLEY